MSATPSGVGPTSATPASPSSSSSSSSSQRATLVSPWWLVLVGLIPFAPLTLALALHAPLHAPGVVSLAGTWQVFAGDRAPTSIVAAEVVDPAALSSSLSSSSTTVTTLVPGPLPPTSRLLRIARRFTIEGDPVPSLLVFGGVANGVADVWINGRWLGGEGVSERGYKLPHVALSAYPVPAELLVRGDNLIVVAIAGEESLETGPFLAMVDRRLVIGPVETTRPWFDRVTVVEQLFDLGGVFLLLFVTALVMTLSWPEQERRAREVQWAAAAFSGAIAVYLAGKSGLLIACGFPRQVVPMAISAMALAMPEMLERAFFGRVSRLQQLNRVVCGVHIVILVFSSSPFAYLGFIPWLFFLMGFGVVIGVRGIRLTPTVETVLLASSVFAIFVSGLNDLLTDLNVIAAPRLFTLSAIDMAIVGSVFVVGRFLRTMGENAHLLRDIEHKNAELVKALRKAEESTRLKSAFLANTSHELRTPLNSIINVPEGLLEDFVEKNLVRCSACDSVFEAAPDETIGARDACPECSLVGTLSLQRTLAFVGDPETATKYLHSIQQSGRHLLAVVDDILDFSKLDAGRMTLHVEDTELDDVLGKLELAMVPLADARRIRLVTDRPGAARLRTDPVKLTQVLMNLVSNAIKFSPEDSEVRVGVVVTDDDITLTVADRGIGIAPADQSRIFESFLQLDNSHTRKVGGTGLGLAITKKIVELMKGTLRVESAVGTGSTFTVVVPRWQPPTVPPLASSTTTSESLRVAVPSKDV